MSRVGGSPVFCIQPICPVESSPLRAWPGTGRLPNSPAMSSPPSSGACCAGAAVRELAPRGWAEKASAGFALAADFGAAAGVDALAGGKDGALGRVGETLTRTGPPGGVRIVGRARGRVLRNFRHWCGADVAT